MTSKNLLILLFLIIIIIIGVLFFYKNKSIDSFSNLYTTDNCCTEQNIATCEKYGKTGVCNYFENNKECMCQDSF